MRASLRKHFHSLQEISVNETLHWTMWLFFHVHLCQLMSFFLNFSQRKQCKKKLVNTNWLTNHCKYLRQRLDVDYGWSESQTVPQRNFCDSSIAIQMFVTIVNDQNVKNVSIIIVTVCHMGSKLLSHGSKDVFCLRRASTTLNVFTLLRRPTRTSSVIGFAAGYFLHCVSMSGRRTRFSKYGLPDMEYFEKLPRLPDIETSIAYLLSLVILYWLIIVLKVKSSGNHFHFLKEPFARFGFTVTELKYRTLCVLKTWQSFLSLLPQMSHLFQSIKGKMTFWCLDPVWSPGCPTHESNQTM